VIRAVVDTNLLVSYLLTHRPPIATLIDHPLARDDYLLVTAPELLAELDRVLRYPKLQRYYTEKDRTRFVALVMALSELVELPTSPEGQTIIPRICRDPDDDRVIACAIAGRADVIVSGDDDLLNLEQVGDIPILTAAQFLDLLEDREHE
jgi:putative PIN family toxin of toxin-antitoxin system